MSTRTKVVRINPNEDVSILYENLIQAYAYKDFGYETFKSCSQYLWCVVTELDLLAAIFAAKRIKYSELPFKEYMRRDEEYLYRIELLDCFIDDSMNINDYHVLYKIVNEAIKFFDCSIVFTATSERCTEAMINALINNKFKIIKANVDSITFMKY